MADLGIYRTLGSNLIYQGKMFLNKATPIKKTVYTASQILTAMGIYTRLPASKVYSADEKHHTTDIETWKGLIKDDWIEKKIWTTDTFDCDNFAGSFTAHMADIYGLNSAARITAELKDPISGKHIGYHRAAMIVDDKLDCWLLETQTDKMVKMEIDKNPIIDNWEYVPNYVDIN